MARLSANLYDSYVHVIRALSSEVLTTVRNLMRDITAATLQSYLLIKDALLSWFTASPLQQCFRILDMPPLGDRRPSALFAEMQSLLPRDANVLFNPCFCAGCQNACGDSCHPPLNYFLFPLAWYDKGHQHLGQTMCSLPNFQSSYTCLSSAHFHSYSFPPFFPHPHRPRRSPAPFPRSHPHPHRHGSHYPVG